MNSGAVDLKRLQEILYRLITAPTGVAEGLARETMLPDGALDELVKGDDRMTAVERVEVYATGYFYRILEVLKEDFPATQTVVGADIFHNLATGYLIDYPPTEPSLYFAGRNFAAFLAVHPLSERWPFLADLARLERANLESFHAADAHALEAGAMRAIAPADWPSLVLRTHPATRLLDSRWRVDQLLRAVEDRVTWRLPDREAVTIVVWRRDAQVAYRAVETAEREALRLASKEEGALFGIICEAIATAASADEDVASMINSMLARWLRDGLLMSVSD